MIHLKNVKKEGDVITADYYPEDSKVGSEVKLNVKTKEFFGQLVGHDIESDSHLAHARMALNKMSDGSREIADCKIMWY